MTKNIPILNRNGSPYSGSSNNKVNMTNGDLVRMHYEMDNWKRNKSAMFFFNRSKIQDFYNKNGVLIQSFGEKQKELETEYFLHDEKGLKVMEGEGQEKRPTMVEGKLREDYSKNINELINEIVAVSL